MTFVVVGAGLAGAKAVEELRSTGHAGPIALVGAEPHLPYERPPLTKGFLMDQEPLESAFVHDPQWYDDQDIALHLGTHVVAIDTRDHVVRTDDGQLTYDKLLVATGSQPRPLPLADASGGPVAYLRTLEDSQRIKGELADGRRIVVIGAGWLGLEVASAARLAGCSVTVVETQALPLVGVLGPEIAEVFAALHRAHGVDLRLGTGVTAIDAGRVHLQGADSLAYDLLVVGIGAVPDTTLAESSGLAADNGILVDEHLRTSDHDVFAAGDVANQQHPLLRRRIRVEHWDNAIHQGRVAARNMLGAGETYERLPYFFTDQYDFGMEYVGSVGPEGYDRVVVRGDLETREFTAFWTREEQILAGMHANVWDATDAIRALVGHTVDLARLADADVPLAEVAQG